MTLIHRYVRFPNGRRVELTARLVPTGGKAEVLPVRSARSSARARAAADCSG
jgi:hypothetical protein